MADWYEENGQAERAERIRHQIATDRVFRVQTSPTFIYSDGKKEFSGVWVIYRRGFVECIICGLSQFLQHAKWIAHNWPVKEVVISDADRCLDADNIHLGPKEWSAACIEYLKQVRQGNPEPRLVFTINSTRVADVRVVLQGRPPMLPQSMRP